MNFQKRLLEIVTPTLFLPLRKNLLRQTTGYSTRETFFFVAHTPFYSAPASTQTNDDRMRGEVQNKTDMPVGFWWKNCVYLRGGKVKLNHHLLT